MNLNLLILILPLFISCARPTAHVYQEPVGQGQENIKLCVLGNVGQNSLAQRTVRDSLAAEGCSQVYFLGDLVKDEAIYSLEDPAFLDYFLAYYQPLLINQSVQKINLLLGESEYLGNALVWLEIDDKYEGFFFPNFYYMINYGGLCIVALDSNMFTLNLPNEVIEQTIWMSQLQSDLKACSVKVALSHHPFKGDKLPASVVSGWVGSSGALKLFLDTYIVGKVDFHISGHVPALADDGVDEGTKLLISGAGGIESGTAGYLILIWNQGKPNRLSYRFKKMPIDEASSP